MLCFPAQNQITAGGVEISDWTRLIVLGTYPQYRQNTQQLWDTHLLWTSHDTSDCRLLAGGA